MSPQHPKKPKTVTEHSPDDPSRHATMECLGLAANTYARAPSMPFMANCAATEQNYLTRYALM
jgi:hypothetical protein